MSDGGRESSSVSPALRELSARVRAMEETLGDWPEVVGESVARALRAAEKRGVAHQEELAGKWAERLGGEVERQKALTAQLNQEAHNLRVVLSWQQEMSGLGLWGVSKGMWRVVVVSVLLALGVSWGGAAVYDKVGPPAKARAETAATLSNFRAWWNAATEAQRAAIQAQRVEQLQQRRQAPGQEGGR